MNSVLLETTNDILTCHIYPWSKFPNGLNLTYNTCPESFDNQSSKIVRYCCLNIMIALIQDSFYKKTQDWLRYNSSSILVGPAVVFNILSLLVLTKFNRLRNVSKNSTTFYMKCLCIFDTFTIVSKFLNEIIVVRNGLRQDPWKINSLLCKFLSFFESCAAISSIYILIVMSFEKLICVIMPLEVGIIFTRFKAKIIFLSILVISGLISSYNFFDKEAFIFEWFEEIQRKNFYHKTNFKNNTVGKVKIKRVSYDCDSKWPQKKNDWLLFNNLIRVFLPIILLCACNFWIIVALAKAKKKSQALFSSDRYCKITYSNKNSQSIKLKIRKMSKLPDKCLEKQSSRLNFDRAKKISNINLQAKKNAQHISIMLVAISVGFVICNLPFAIRTLFHRYFSEKFKLIDYLYYSENLFTLTTSRKEILNSVKYEFFSSLTYLLLDLNYIMNFFFFFLSGSRFRTQLFTIFKCAKHLDKKSNIYLNSTKKTNNFDSFLKNRFNSNLSIKNGSENNNETKDFHSNII